MHKSANKIILLSSLFFIPVTSMELKLTLKHKDSNNHHRSKKIKKKKKLSKEEIKN